ncbi:aminotransferase class I/II-fold pyridoxal phosphate-dependent enzyme [Streptomyces sp. GbtcB6]|uniref:aminotransferase class I/II-fold pyridoxal phosphate-dependent enzyme n=1 Tax=Streptomyces sp. GbtcB6 TaxID=2824751 RepID=UPI0020C71014|nr:aminotransferase class I/II-fold pyridoxal phosphate-dependent enzyme [Streptomyces sp. GbtcB6]
MTAGDAAVEVPRAAAVGHAGQGQCVEEVQLAVEQGPVRRVAVGPSIGLRVLESNDELLDERRELLVKRRQVLVDLLREHFPDWRFTTPGGGLSLWVDLGARLGPALAQAAGRRGVRIYSGGRFGEDGTLDNHIRVPYVADEESLSEGCKRLAEAWGEVCARRVDRSGGRAEAPAERAGRSAGAPT